MKDIYRVYFIIILGVMGIFIIYLYNSTEYIKYDEIENHIEKEVGHDIIIRKELEKSELYYVFNYKGADNKQYLGMSIYEKKLFGRYKRIGMSLNNKMFGRYYAGNPLIYCIFGENKNHKIYKIKIDFGDFVYEDKIDNQDFFFNTIKIL